MAADQTATLGPASPPARGSQGGAPTVAHGGSAPSERNTEWAATVTGATYRQLDYWIRNGILGEHLASIGSGNRRTFTDEDIEVAAALARLAALGCRGEWLHIAANKVREELVRPGGEWLLVTIAGHALRCTPADLPRIVHHGDEHAAWLIPLQAFDQGQPL